MNWLYIYWFNYEWPSDKGNGPEAITEIIVVGIITALLVPPVRRWFLRGFHSIKAHITKEHAAAKEHMEAEHKKIRDTMETEHAKIHEKMDHIIFHSPNIPDFESKEKNHD
jgi:UPF0716 family protein affecting phage T7 exclusion